MKITLATLVASLALACADEKNGQLRATDRGLIEQQAPTDAPELFVVPSTKVCQWMEYGTDEADKKISALHVMGKLNIVEGVNSKNPTVCLYDDKVCKEEDKVVVDGKRLFLADEATTYQNTQPVMGSLGYNCEITRSGTSSGDPHVHMFTGKAFDFMGGCDLVLLENPTFNNGQGITVHIRTKIRTWYSYIESVVVKIGNDTLEVKSGFEERQYWVNGEAGDKKQVVSGGYLPFTIGGFPVRFRVPKDNVFQFRIFLNDGQDVVVRSVKDFLRVDLKHANSESFSGSSGLMGDFGSLEFMARDGQTVLEDQDDYGKEWQVLSTEPMLFHDVDGVQHPEMCAMPDKDLVEKRNRRRLGEGPVSRRAAEDACADAEADKLEDCIEDVIATGDLEYAMEYGAV